MWAQCLVGCKHIQAHHIHLGLLVLLFRCNRADKHPVISWVDILASCSMLTWAGEAATLLIAKCLTVTTNVGHHRMWIEITLPFAWRYVCLSFIPPFWAYYLLVLCNIFVLTLPDQIICRKRTMLFFACVTSVSVGCAQCLFTPTMQHYTDKKKRNCRFSIEVCWRSTLFSIACCNWPPLCRCL